MRDEEIARMREIAEQWHQATDDVVRVVNARMRQLELWDEERGEYERFLDHPDLAVLDLTLENWYGDGTPEALPE